MVLSGTLKEFILADVFQLLTQQKITGKLILNNGNSEGIVTFKDGAIISAEKENENIISKLNYFLTDVKLQSIENVKELINSYDDNLNELTSQIIKKGITTQNEMSFFAESVIEDITCSFFQWKTGTYHFNSLRSVESSIICGIVIPIENIVMEAMRRCDEWNRMVETISEETIFLHTEKSKNDSVSIPDPIKSTDQYLYKKINGTTPVKDFFIYTCLTEYKVYEALNILKRSNKITALSSKFSLSVNAALLKKQRKSIPVHLATALSIISTVIIILISIFLPNFVLKNNLFPHKTTKAYMCKVESLKSNAQQNLSIARLYYRAQYGVEATSFEDFKNYFLLSSDDFYFFK